MSALEMSIIISSLILHYDNAQLTPRRKKMLRRIHVQINILVEDNWNIRNLFILVLEQKFCSGSTTFQQLNKVIQVISTNVK